ncbi:MAG: hypothetical protein U9Q88_02190, partial [Bacillota bacterium]|nr:hypothetical protein [Bacillota bacterium]
MLVIIKAVNFRSRRFACLREAREPPDMNETVKAPTQLGVYVLFLCNSKKRSRFYFFFFYAFDVS